MSPSLIVMSTGLFFIIISFFIKDRSKKIEKDVEELSINIYQETNTLKRRLKIVEEELLVDPQFKVPAAPVKQTPVQATKPVKSPMETFQQVAAQVQSQKGYQTYKSSTTTAEKPIHSILVSQVIELNKQGLSIEEISKRSTLSHDQIQSILLSNGGF